METLRPFIPWFLGAFVFSCLLGFTLEVLNGRSQKELISVQRELISVQRRAIELRDVEIQRYQSALNGNR